MTHRHAQRGQALPLWIAAIVTTFTLMFLAINYGNAIRWQIRAQNAADAAAQAMMAVQTERWNMMTEMLYASSVEEYRIRYLLQGMLMATTYEGGCNPNGEPNGPTNFPGSVSCASVYASLSPYYFRAVNRYTTDLLRLNDVAISASYSSWQSDVTALATHLQGSHCNTVGIATPNPDGGDCGFKYTVNGTAQRGAGHDGALQPVIDTGWVVFVPTQGFTTTDWPADGENQSLFAPGMVDVVTCAKVPPIIPSFGPFKLQPYYAIGRAGATAAMFEEDWLQPGSLVDNAGRPSGTKFQPVETYSNANSGQPYDWYGTNFGGNTFGIQPFNLYTPNPSNTTTPIPTGNEYTSWVQSDDLSAYAGWWSSIPVDPRYVDSKAVVTSTVCPP